MQSMLFAEFAVFVHFNPVGVIFFILHGVVISLLAFGALQSYLISHFKNLLKFFNVKK
jgi:hypothetical protein